MASEVSVVEVVAEAEQVVVGNTNYMSRYLYFILLTLNCNYLFAQLFEVLQTQKNITTVHIPQQEILIQSEMSKNTLYNIHSKTKTGYKLQSRLKLLTGKLNLFGQEQVFNSNDTSTLNIDGGNAIKNLLNLSREITVQNNQITSTQNDSTDLFFSVINENAAKFILTIPFEKIRLGYNWSDFLITDKSKSVSEYYISNLTYNTFEVSEYASIKKTVVLNQNNQTVKQELKGYANSIRWYSLATQILQSEEITTKLIGITESGDTRFPITIDSKMSILVKPIL